MTIQIADLYDSYGWTIRMNHTDPQFVWVIRIVDPYRLFSSKNVIFSGDQQKQTTKIIQNINNIQQNNTNQQQQTKYKQYWEGEATREGDKRTYLEEDQPNKKKLQRERKQPPTRSRSRRTEQRREDPPTRNREWKRRRWSAKERTKEKTK